MIAEATRHRSLAACILFVLVVALGACASAGPELSPPANAHASEEPLAGWHETDAKRAILRFVEAATRPGSESFIPPEHRIATFDFDGTVGCEKPDYMEVMVAMRRLCELTVNDPDLLDQPLYRAACDGDLKTIDSSVEEALLEAFEGESQSFYVNYVESFLDTVHHPRFDRPYGQLYYLPMRQLIDFLSANGFTVYLVSGSQQGFTRSFGTHVLEIPPVRSIGHAVELDFSVVDGQPTLLRQDAFLPPSVGGKGKAEIIRNRIGRPPVLAFGNSMGDFEMLQYATSGEHVGLGLILVHDDPREYVYRDSELIEKAQALGWQIVTMKDHFERVFPPETPRDDVDASTLE